MNSARRISGSFRDPAGFVFTAQGEIYRQINHTGKADFEQLMQSGLYARLTKSGDLIEHSDADVHPAEAVNAWKIIQPGRIPLISFPYEWCFGQLKAAALLTLRIEKAALGRGMTLKDASAYNVQFRGSKPVFIDTLSFAAYRDGEPWAAYGQYCRHFLAPLLLMRYSDIRLGGLLAMHGDGLPLDMVSSLLPRRTYLRFSILTHIHLHARAQQSAARGSSGKKYKVSKNALIALLENLQGLVQGLRWIPRGTAWADYTECNNYGEESLQHKKETISAFISAVKPANVWDVGANTGEFSRLASAQGIFTLASDIDAAAVEKNYRRAAAESETQLLPLVTDLTNPAPGTGWENSERPALTQRVQADMILALALVHHLAITHNIPLARIARFFADHCRSLAIEFIPKTDSQVVRMLSTRSDIFTEYSQAGFEAAFGEFFTIQQVVPIRDSVRILYLMLRR